jgi:hypothetical protein
VNGLNWYLGTYMNVKSKLEFHEKFQPLQIIQLCFLVYLMAPCQLQTLINSESETVECYKQQSRKDVGGRPV